jgi:hypothetical protein
MWSSAKNGLVQPSKQGRISPFVMGEEGDCENRDLTCCPLEVRCVTKRYDQVKCEVYPYSLSQYDSGNDFWSGRCDIIVTHDPQIADESDVIIRMESGKIVS